MHLDEIEVTPEMIEAGLEYYPCRDDAAEYNIYFLTRIYRAMANKDQRYGMPDPRRLTKANE